MAFQCNVSSLAIHLGRGTAGPSPHAACVAVFVVSSLAAGCVAIGADAAYSAAFRTKFVDATQLSEHERQQLGAMRIYDSSEALTFASLGKVTGLACSLSVAPLVPVFYWNPPLSDINGKTPQEVAMTQMKLKALKLGASAVVAPSCEHHEWVDWGNNCFESWACTAEAVQRIQ